MSALPAILATVLLFAGAGAQAAVPYHVVDLGTLGGIFSAAHGVNAGGDVVGEASTAAATTHAFLYHAGALTDLGTLPGGTYSVALAVNASGFVVGYADTAGGDTHGFAYAGGQMTDLGTFPGVACTAKDEPCSLARGVNDLGTTVGDAQVLRGGKLHRDGFALDQGKPFTILTPPDVPDSVIFGGSLAVLTGINSRGHTAGYACPAKTSCIKTATGYTNVRAIYYSLSGTWHPLDGFPGGDTSIANAINESDQIVGGANTTPGGAPHAFLSNAGTADRSLHDLGTLGGVGSTAYAINGPGQIVGTALAADGTTHAVLWEEADSAPPADLATLLPVNPGWILTSAAGINDAGAIVGAGTIGGQPHAFLMLPGAGPATSTTTVTTTTTTTTVPRSAACTATSGDAAAPCLLQALADQIAAAPPTELRNDGLRLRLKQMVNATLFRVRTAGTGRRRARRLRAAQRRLSTFLGALQRGVRRGQIAADLGLSLRTLAMGAATTL